MKKIFFIALMLCAMLMLAACSGANDVPVYDDTAVPPETAEELYSYYSQVHRGMTRAAIEALFGAGEVKCDEDGVEMYHSYRNEKKSAGVNVIYRPDDTVYGKILYYNRAADLVPFSNAYDETRIQEIPDNAPIDRAAEVFGQGLELAETYGEMSKEQVSNIYSWFNADGTNFQIHATNGVITQRVLNKPEW